MSLRISQEYQQQQQQQQHQQQQNQHQHQQHHQLQQHHHPSISQQQITTHNNHGHSYNNNDNLDMNHNHHYMNDYQHPTDSYYQNDAINGKKYKQDINQQVHHSTQPHSNSHVDLSKSNHNSNNGYHSNDLKSSSNKNHPLSHTDEYLINNFRPFSNNTNNAISNSNNNNNNQQQTISSSSSTSNKSRYSSTTLTQPAYPQPQSHTNNLRSSQINIPNPTNSVSSPTRHCSIINNNNNPKVGHLSHELINNNNTTYHNYNNHSNHLNYHKQSLMDLTSNNFSSSYTAPRNRKIQSILLNDEKPYSKSPNLGYSSSFSKSIVNLNGNSHSYGNSNYDDDNEQPYYSAKRVDLSGKFYF